MTSPAKESFFMAIIDRITHPRMLPNESNEEHKERHKTLKGLFIILVFLAIGEVSRLLFTNDMETEASLIIPTIILPFVFLLVGKSHFFAFKVIYTLLMSFQPIYCYFNPKYALAMTIYTCSFAPQNLYLLKEPKLFFFMCCFHAVYLLRYSKDLLVELIMTNTPEKIAEMMIEKLTILFFFGNVIYYRAHKDLINSYSEVKEASKRERESYDQLKTFLLSVSHELRNPINSLLGSLNLALQEMPSKAVCKYLETGKICTELLLQLINNILDSGKAELGTLEVNPRAIDLKDSLAKVWEISKELIQNKGLQGILIVDKNVPPNLTT